MSGKIHIGKNGVPAKCTATVKACPVGGEHYESMSEAIKAVEEKGRDNANTFNNLTKKNDVNNYEKVSKILEGDRGVVQDNEAAAVKLYEGINSKLSNEEYSAEELDKVNRAMNMAWHLHRGQTRKAQDVAYIEHPLSNLSKIMEYGVRDSSILAAAALHDVVEDSTKEYSQFSGEKPSRSKLLKHIEKSFGKDTAEIVEAVSNKEGNTSGMSTEEKNRAYANHVREQIEGSQGAMLVKFSDYLDNAGTLRDAKFDDPKRKLKLAVKYQPIAEIFKNASLKHRQGEGYAFNEIQHVRFMSALNNINDDLNDVIEAESNKQK